MQVITNFRPKHVFISLVALKSGLHGRSRSLKMAPIDRSYTTLYWSAIVSIALSCIIFELFDVQNVMALKSSLWITRRHYIWDHSIERIRYPIHLPL